MNPKTVILNIDPIIKQSPPPEQTPSPPPQPPPPVARQVPNTPSHDMPGYSRNSEVEVPAGGNANPSSMPNQSPSQGNQYQSHTQPHVPQYHQHSASSNPTQIQYAPPISSVHTPTHHNAHSSPHSSHQDHYSTPQTRYPHPQPSHRPGILTSAILNPPRPVEVYHLGDSANASIPEDIREQFHRDEQGHVLFFTTPPLDVLPPAKPGSAIGHTARYLAKKLRLQIARKEKRKAEGLPEIVEDSGNKKPRLGAADPSVLARVEQMRDRALDIWMARCHQGTVAICKDIYGEMWEQGMEYEHEKLVAVQRDNKLRTIEWEESKRRREEKEKVSLNGTGLFLDDFDPRY